MESHFEEGLSKIEPIVSKIENCFAETGIFNIKDEKVKQVSEKVENLFLTLKQNLELQKFRKAIDDALVLGRYMDKTFLKGKRRFYEPIRKNYGRYKEIERLLEEFVDESRELIKIQKLVKVG